MHRLLLPLTLGALVLAVPIVPFLLLGGDWEQHIDQWIRQPRGAAGVAAGVVGLLAVDILLPVPSSVVSTVAGASLGFLAGTAASWLGMTLGAAIGFALARLFGRPLAERLSRRDDLDHVDRVCRRFGPMVAVLARPIPIFAEASVLLLGTSALGFRPFLFWVALSNLGIAAAYAALGTWTRLPVAIAASIVIPLLATVIARRFFQRGGRPGNEPP